MPPAAFFSHTTAALLMQAPIPLVLERDPVVHIAVPSPARAPHATGLQGHALAVDLAVDVVERRGLRLSAPGRTFIDLALVLALEDLVAVGDHLIHHRLPHVAIEELADRAERLSRQRGRAKARAAVALLDDRAESPAESRIRVLLTRAGIPAPVVNRPVLDPVTEREIRPDLSWPERRVALDHHGDYHRDSAQWRADVRRRARLEELGWAAFEATADDLGDVRELVRRLLRALSLRS